MLETRWVVLLVVAIIVTGTISLACIYQGIFFASFPIAYDAVQFTAKQVGYNFNCSDVHGGWKCRILEIPQTAEEVEADRRRAMEARHCNEDSDCILTETGECVRRGYAAAAIAPKKECVCLINPTVYGCVLKEELE